MWTQLGGEVRGAAWYLSNTTTPSTSTRPGDLLLRTDTGDIWQRTGAGWGTAVGNLKGPKGDKGDSGSAGATGPAGVVQSVNGKSAAAITLTAADVGALATAAAGAASGIATLGADGKVPAAQLPTSSGGGAVASVNGKTGAVVLAASDVGALPESGFVAGGNLILNTATVDYRGLSFTTAGVNRWVYQVDNTAEAGADAGSNFELANWTDQGEWKSAVLYGQRATGNIGIGTNSLIPGAKLSVAGAAALKNTAPPPADVGAAIAYSEGGLFKVVQADGTRVTLAPAEAAGTAVLLTGTQTVAGAKTFSSVPSSSAAPTADNHLARKSYVDALGGGGWRASDFGLLTWAFDPACGHSAPLYPGAGPIRVTAVYLRSAASVTKVVWHFGGYGRRARHRFMGRPLQLHRCQGGADRRPVDRCGRACRSAHHGWRDCLGPAHRRLLRPRRSLLHRVAVPVQHRHGRRPDDARRRKLVQRAAQRVRPEQRPPVRLVRHRRSDRPRLDHARLDGERQ